MDPTPLIESAARSIAALAPALDRLAADAPELDAVRHATKRGYFTPEEDDQLRPWWARYLTGRAALFEVLEDLRPFAQRRVLVEDDDQYRCFLVGYTAACLLVQGGRFLVNEIAVSPVVRRKLDEEAPRFRIPRKQYTVIFKSLTNPYHAWQLLEAMRFAKEHRDDLERVGCEPTLIGVWTQMIRAEVALEVPARRYAKARLGYRWHSWRRRRRSAANQAVFALFEGFGRVIAEMRVGREHRALRVAENRLNELLQPGDVIVTRHDYALSNLFLPGFWPHAALHVGDEHVKVRLELDRVEPRSAPWVNPCRVLEARKDGVLFRQLDDTLSVDAFTVIRPRLAPDEIDTGIARAVSHAGKLYNFDFDFFAADRLVCTEVVYRAYDGLGDIHMPLTKRSGKLTFSAEDLLDLAVDGRGFDVIAIYGTPDCPNELVEGPRARELLAASYRAERA